MPPLSRSSSRSSSDRIRKSRSSSSSRRRSGSSCSAIGTRPLHQPLVGVGGVQVRFLAVPPQREHDASRPECEHDDRQDPHEQADAGVLGREEDRVPVPVDVRLADLLVALPRGDPPLDVGPDGARRRRLAVGDREALALRTLELRLELVRPCRRRLLAVRPQHDCQRDGHDDTQRDPRAPAAHHPDARAAARNDSSSVDDIGPYFAAATRPPGEMAYVSGCPRVAKSSAATFSGSSAMVQPTWFFFTYARTSPVVSSRTMPTITKSDSSLCAAKNCCNAGASCWHGMHQEFQKLTMVALPATSASFTRPPARFGRSKSGAAFPTRWLCFASCSGSFPTFRASTTPNTTTTSATASATTRAGCFTR